jgi:formiminotetrahydrofolate cyclodeaminase
VTDSTVSPDRRSWTLADYAAAVASADPTPGGGSVAATVAAFAAALAEMVCTLTLARPIDADTESALSGARAIAAHQRNSLLALAGDDELAYAGYRRAADLPRATEEEREARRVALEAALEQAADVPLRVESACVELITTLETVASLGTKHALADVRTSLRLADAALASALEMVRANTGLMRDRARASKLDQDAHNLLAQGRQSTAKVNQILATREG